MIIIIIIIIMMMMKNFYSTTFHEMIKCALDPEKLKLFLEDINLP